MSAEVLPVSVVITTYNRARFVLEAVNSVVRQRYVKPLEVVVVDDGSTDDTREILSSVIDSIRYIKQDNLGVSCARNRGIESSRGEWIAFLDSDDLWLPEKLFRHWDFISRNPGILVSQTDELWIRDGVKLNPRKYHEKPEGYCFEKLLKRCLISPSAVIIHRSVFDMVGTFDERIPACEDYDLWLRIGYRLPVGLLKEKLIVKRGGHKDQLSHTVEALDRFRIFSMAKLLIRENLSEYQREAVFEELSNKCRIYSCGALRRGKNRAYRFFSDLPSMMRQNIIKDEKRVLEEIFS